MRFLIVTGVIEAGTGAALLASPSAVVWILLGTSLDTPTELTISRIGGAALLALGTACWLVRCDAQSGAAMGLITGMLLYNTGAVALLVYAGLGNGLVGVGLWPGVGLHLAMLAWCLASLWTGPSKLAK